MRLPHEFRDRTNRFASSVVRLYVALPRARKEVQVLGHQLLRSGTSVAAHVREASRARSKPEFTSKINGALQEADESQLWLELLRDDCAIASDELDGLWREADDLIRVCVSMAHKTARRRREHE